MINGLSKGASFSPASGLDLSMSVAITPLLRIALHRQSQTDARNDESPGNAGDCQGDMAVAEAFATSERGTFMPNLSSFATPLCSGPDLKKAKPRNPLG